MQPNESEFPPGDRFEMLARLGAGGMGVVFKARDRQRNTEIAIKTLRIWTAEAILRFKNEFRALQDLQHRNLVSLGELISEGGRWFFTMELVEGVDLIAYVRPADGAAQEEPPNVLPPRPPLDGSRLRAALAQLADGLLALHDARKVHRDIKPSNILVTGQGRVVLLDFGLATETGSQPWSDVHVVGTADYMAPEQAASRPVGPPADWYSVGVVLYEALTGALPFSGAPLEVMMQKQRDEPLPPSALAPDVPPDLDGLCAELLRTDPRARPDGREVLRRLGGPGAAAPRAAPSSTLSAPFVGRRRELEQLGDAFAATRRGCAITVIVDGESGMGKSALVRRFTEQARAEHQAVVLAGRCHERESVPYKALDGVIDALSGQLLQMSKVEAAALLPRWAGPLAQVFPVLRRVDALSQAPLGPGATVDPREQRERVFAALRELLARLGERRPLVVVIDDLQWADADSLALLAEVMHPPEAPSLLLVATMRAEATPTDLGGETRRLHVGRLAPEEARELAALLLARAAESPAPAAAQAIADEAGGHPLFIDELVRHFAAPGHARDQPLALEEALWRRIERHEPAERELLELASVVGRPCALEVAARALGIDLGELGRRAACLRVAHLMRSGGARGADAIEPYHDRIRAAVLAHLAPEARRAHHQRLARAMETLGATDLEALHAHWQEAGDAERAGHYAARAAERAAEALAFDRAARLYRAALELRPRTSGRSGVRDPVAAEARRLRQQLGDALANAGRGAAAAQAYLEATVGANAADALELRRRAAEQLLRTGHVDEGLATVRTVLDAVGLRLADTPVRALTSFLLRRAHIRLRGLGFREVDESQLAPARLTLIDTCWSVATGLAMVDPIRGADFQTRHLLLALEAGEPYRVARALAMEAAYSGVDGGRSWKRTEQLLAAATALAARIDHPHAIGLTTTVAGSASFLIGRWRDALRHCESAVEVFRDRCAGATWELHTSQHFALQSLVMMGELAELQRRVPGLRRAARERGDLWMSAVLRISLVNYCPLAADEPERARQEIAEALEEWSQRGFHLQHYWELLASVQTDLYVGDGPRAYARMTERWRAVERSLVLRVQLVQIEALHLRARSALAAASRLPAGRERQRLLDAAERDAQRIAQERMHWSNPIAELVRAGVAAARGESVRALAHLAAAAARFDTAEMHLHAACARRRQAMLVGGTEGQALRAAADGWMAGQAIRNPQRMTDLIAPGFPA